MSIPISGGNARVSYELWRATIDNELVEDLSDYLADGSVNLNLDQAIKLSASITMRDPSRVTPYRDFLAPFINVSYPDARPSISRQIGLYTTRLPSGSAKRRGEVGTFDCEDLCRILAKNAFTDTHNIAAGSNVVTAATAIVTFSGISRVNFPATSRTLSDDLSLHIQSTRLDGVNDLFSAIGWYDVGTDLDGRISNAGPVLDISKTHPFRTLTEDDLRGPIAKQQTDIDIANVVEVINASATDTPMKAIARNDDPASPTSTVSVGYEIGLYKSVNGDTTQDDLDALAARYLAEAKSYNEVIQIQIEPDPDALTPRQTIELDFNGAFESFSGIYWVRAAHLGFKPSQGLLTLDLNRLTSTVSGVLL